MGCSVLLGASVPGGSSRGFCRDGRSCTGLRTKSYLPKLQPAAQHVVCRRLVAGFRRAPCTRNKAGIQQTCDAVNQVVAVRDCLAKERVSRVLYAGWIGFCAHMEDTLQSDLVQVEILCGASDLHCKAPTLAESRSS